MNNEPVAWMNKINEEWVTTTPDDSEDEWIPLYTHPVKGQKCVVQDCENHKNEGGFTGDLCNPCYQFIANGEGVYSQAYRNVHPVKDLTDEEIFKTAIENGAYQNKESGHIYPDDMYILNFARAILRKASEK